MDPLSHNQDNNLRLVNNNIISNVCSQPFHAKNFKSVLLAAQITVIGTKMCA